jgi:acetolactate synthase-1/2/3 large subunit
LIVIGAGMRRYADDVRDLVDALDVPFVTTPQAKGIVSELHARSLRSGGLGASLWARSYTQRGVDVTLALGTDLDDCAMGPTRYVSPEGKLVHVDLNAAVFNRNLPVALGVVADAGSFARSLSTHVREHKLKNPHIQAEMRDLKRSSTFDDANFETDQRSPISPQRAIADLERACGRAAMYITDIGEHMLFAFHYLTSERPDSFHVQLSLGSMGSGVCGAIGLALGQPGRRVVCICGDGGLQMAGMELLVAVKERLPIVYAVFNDARYNMVYHGHKQLYGRDAAWETPWVDFVGWAASLGIPALLVERPGEISAASIASLSAGGGPVLLDIRIDRDVRMKAGGRNESLLHMSLGSKAEP